MKLKIALAAATMLIAPAFMTAQAQIGWRLRLGRLHALRRRRRR